MVWSKIVKKSNHLGHEEQNEESESSDESVSNDTEEENSLLKMDLTTAKKEGKSRKLIALQEKNQLLKQDLQKTKEDLNNIKASNSDLKIELNMMDQSRKKLEYQLMQEQQRILS